MRYHTLPSLCLPLLALGVIAACRSDRPFPDRPVTPARGGGAGGGMGGAAGDAGIPDRPDVPGTGGQVAPDMAPPACAPGHRLCGTACIPDAQPCGTDCPDGKNHCNGSCVEETSLLSCGTACKACPTSPNGKATCDGDKCDLECNPGFHLCGTECVPDDDATRCGATCSACAVPTGGQAACRGGACVPVCPANTRHCMGACIPPERPCNDMCTGNQRACNGACVAPDDVMACGPACQRCVPPKNARATCTGAGCDFSCNPGFHRCGNECRDDGSVDSCGTRCQACPAVPNGKAACRSGQCDFTCNANHRRCGDRCIPDAEPCGNDCRSGWALCRSRAVCVPAGSITAETCDGRDNDCDGAIDEEIAPRPCPCGGPQRCTGGRWDPAACSNPQTDPTACGAMCTRCPGGDNAVPICRAGACTTECAPRHTLCRATGRCVPSESVTPERCDGQDNDCDGQIDEEIAPLPCEGGCGVRRCVGGGFEPASVCPDTSSDPRACGRACAACRAPTPDCRGGQCVPALGCDGPNEAVLPDGSCGCVPTHVRCGDRCIAFQADFCVHAPEPAGDYCTAVADRRRMPVCPAGMLSAPEKDELTRMCNAAGNTGEVVYQRYLFSRVGGGRPMMNEQPIRRFCCEDCKLRRGPGARCEGPAINPLDPPFCRPAGM